ncbi:hypothetical protein EYF80_019223 [Liparis tanakae]|uniref:Uncharacterized protein n=1 Tax=Liparis tanakae TaxID=230148 RepID=A0A4Z2HXU8_9TELE|nr:hypothetical protein EYF80_019223 [Liparis tanakae]
MEAGGQRDEELVLVLTRSRSRAELKNLSGLTSCLSCWLHHGVPPRRSEAERHAFLLTRSCSIKAWIRAFEVLP